MYTKLYEYIKNTKLATFLIKKVINNINSKLKDKLTRKNFRLEPAGYDFHLAILGIKETDKRIVEKILDSSFQMFMENHLLLIYNSSPEFDIEFSDKPGDFSIKRSKLSGKFTYNIYVREFTIKRFAPPKYLYHQTKKENTESIRKNGLIPKAGTNKDWRKEHSWGHLYAYPHLLFSQPQLKVVGGKEI